MRLLAPLMRPLIERRYADVVARLSRAIAEESTLA
jgi:hypothetical protein